MTNLTLLSYINDFVPLIILPSVPMLSIVPISQFRLTLSNASITFISSMPIIFPSAQASCTQVITLATTSIALL